MTYYGPSYPPNPSYGPPYPNYNVRTNQFRRYWKWWAALIAVALLVLVVVGVIALANTSSTTNAGSPPTSSTIPASNSDQWDDAVCKPGTFLGGRGNGLPNAEQEGFCLSSSNLGSISFGQYSSEYLARNDAAMLRGTASSAMLPDENGYALFVALSDRTGASLQPLAQFGFTITTPISHP